MVSGFTSSHVEACGMVEGMVSDILWSLSSKLSNQESRLICTDNTGNPLVSCEYCDVNTLLSSSPSPVIWVGVSVTIYEQCANAYDFSLY